MNSALTDQIMQPGSGEDQSGQNQSGQNQSGQNQSGESPSGENPDNAQSPDAAPSGGGEPVEVIDNSGEIVRGVSEKSETVGSLLRMLDDLAIRTSNFAISLLDVIVFLTVAMLLIAGTWLLTRLVRSLLKRISKFDRAQTLLAEKIIQILLWTAAFLIGVDLLGIDLTALAVFGGAFGLAIGFGLQKTFGNLIAGIILLLDRSIKPGDVIAVADTAGNETFGEIQKIGIRAVSVTTRDKREYLIPNENLMINQVENWSYSSREVRMQVKVGVSYGADMDLAEELMMKAARETPRVLDNPSPVIWMTEYGDSSVNFTIHCWIVDPEMGVGNVRSDVLKNLWRLLKENNIEIPFPQRDLNLRDNEQMRALIGALSPNGPNGGNTAS